MNDRLDEILGLSPVLPVLVIHDAAHARTIAEALGAGGLRALEVTLRTPAALEAIREMRKIPDVVVGAGTVLNTGDLDAALDAGAEFIVSPGLTDRLARAALEERVPFLPGVANAGDIMRGLDLGLSRFKFFPAVASGGVPALKALAAPFAAARFCPTGGVTQETMGEWLALDAVLCVGGSWLVPAGMPDPTAIAESASMAFRAGRGANATTAARVA